MTSAAEILKAALAHHQAGRLPQAEQLYRQILSTDPRHAQAMHLLGVVAHQAGQHQAAIELISRAISLEPAQASFYVNLGEASRAAGQLPQAEAALGRAIELGPTLPQPRFNLALVYQAQGKFELARECCLAAIARNPNYTEAYNLLGNAERKLGDSTSAEAHYRRALAISPRHFDTLVNYASLLMELQRLPDAASLLQQAIALRPSSAELYLQLGNVHAAQEERRAAELAYEQTLALNPRCAEAELNLGMLLQGEQKYEAAIEHYRRCLQVEPDTLQVQYNLAVSLEQAGHVDAAIEAFGRALALDPRHVDAMTNLGAIHQERGEHDLALEYCNRALDIRPDNAAVRCNRSLIEMKFGDLPLGWQDYEARQKLMPFAPHIVARPQWDGESLGARQLLVHSEQGLGDTMHFIRYVRLLEARGASPLVQVQPPLIPLLAHSGFKNLIAAGGELPHFDCQVPMMSLPWAFRTTLDTVPGGVPYLYAREDLAAQWRERLSLCEGFRVGIHWKGKSSHRGDHARSIALEYFEPLGRVPGVRLISLQQGEGREQLAAVAGRFAIIDLGDQVDKGPGAFMDTAAIMRNLDLIITSDTATAHLAGALGVQVWVALSTLPDWRWLMNREDSPWYPTMRLMRQSTFGDWRELFERIAVELERRAAAT